ncbi:MAG: radical SAM protein, partial [Planctomycetota bacterium]
MSGANARYIATIESVSSCPVNCEMCPVSRTDIPQPKARLMPLDVAGAVAARLRHEFDVKFVAWGNWGEPLVHPEIVQLIQAFGRVGLKNQFLSSSLSAKFDIEGLAHSGLRQLDISISGMTAEVYNVGHKNGRWDLIEENMRKVAEVRRAGAMHLNVDIRWHRYRHNEHQLAAAAEWAK